jgi:hypothetical protein
MKEELDGMAKLTDQVIEQTWPHTMDALVWTSEWMKELEKNPDMPRDTGGMIGWFANAIMAGYDTAMMKRVRHEKPISE